MKICAACSQELPKEKFSKKQWQSKQHRRCKECIADNREVNLKEAPNGDAPPPCVDCEECVPNCSDEDLFKEPQPNDECPICMLQLPLETQMSQHQECCGKLICMGCAHAAYIENNRRLCPFCRTLVATSDGERVKLLKKRARTD